MPKHLLLLLSLTVIIVVAYLTLVLNTSLSQTAPKSEIDTAINQARLLYQTKKHSKEELSRGPCLSDALMPNWVLDIVHNPRQEIDDLPENQCPAMVQGSAQHFVELDLEGNLIRAQ